MFRQQDLQPSQWAHGFWPMAMPFFFFFFFLSDVKKVVVGSKKMPKSSTHSLVRLQTAPGKRKAHGCEPSPLAHFCG
jgi:hypothetical protein